jgi:enoyl-CoA hydratase/carnithine racemase
MDDLAPVITSAGYASWRVDGEAASNAGLLQEAMQAVVGRRDVHCIVLSTDALATDDTLEAGPAGFRWLERFELPTVFCFDGPLAGAVVDVALACDIRICGSGATITSRKPGSRRLLQLIGSDASLELIGRRGAADAETALRWGLVSEVTLPGKAIERATELAATIGSRGPIATKLAKEAIWRGLEMPLEQALRFETDLTLLLQTTKDRAEGVRAFIEKRPPRFTGE